MKTKFTKRNVSNSVAKKRLFGKSSKNFRKDSDVWFKKKVEPHVPWNHKDYERTRRRSSLVLKRQDVNLVKPRNSGPYKITKQVSYASNSSQYSTENSNEYFEASPKFPRAQIGLSAYSVDNETLNHSTNSNGQNKHNNFDRKCKYKIQPVRKNFYTYQDYIETVSTKSRNILTFNSDNINLYNVARKMRLEIKNVTNIPVKLRREREKEVS